MVRSLRTIAIGLVVGVTASGAQAQSSDPGRLFGTVRLMNGDEHTGFIRWDKNEGHWADLLEANKRLARRHLREADDLRGRSRSRERSLRFLGMDIHWGEGRYSRTAQSNIRMGYIDRIEVLDEDYALLTFKSGREQELRRSTTDLGQGNRGIVVESDEGDVELRWRHIDLIDFTDAPRTASPYGERLFGTLETRDGDTFTGWITWDMDEIYASDQLDGRDDGRRESYAFGEIESIERASSSRAGVTLRNGEQVSMRGTNDVNSENRGILVGDPGLGIVTVEWRDFANVRFHEPSGEHLDYATFDRTDRLTGVVRTENGTEVGGTIRWDNDEQWTWEMLDGEYRGMEVDVEFALIRSIAKVSSRAVEVTLLDGRTLELSGSNDVNRENRGIFVEQESGDTVLIEWDEFDRVTFVR